MLLTIFLIEYKLQLELVLGVEGDVDLAAVVVARVGPVQELARAPLLHDVRARPARQLAEPVRAVHDGVRRHLSVAQHEVAVWGQEVIKLVQSDS